MFYLKQKNCVYSSKMYLKKALKKKKNWIERFQTWETKFIKEIDNLEEKEEKKKGNFCQWNDEGGIMTGVSGLWVSQV